MKLFKSTTVMAFLLIFTMVFSTACGGSKTGDNNSKGDGSTVLKLGHMSPETSPSQQYALKFKELIEEKTDGKYKIEIYPAGVLGKDRELAEGLQFGTLDLGIVTTSPMGNFVPEIQTLDLPFLFDGWDHVEKFVASPLAEELYSESEKSKIVTLSLITRGARSVTNSKKPIKTAADLKGLKIRVIESPIYVDTFTELGASPQAMSWGEVFTALQQGTINGHENAINTIHDERVYEVQKYVSLTEHIFAFFGVHASQNFWNNLSAEDQQIFKETAIEVSNEINALQRVEEEEYKQKLIDKGMEINEIDRAPLKDAVQSVYDKFSESHTDKYFKGIEDLR